RTNVRGPGFWREFCREGDRYFTGWYIVRIFDMYRAQIITLLSTLILSCTIIYGQQIVLPNYGLKNPETLEVIRVRMKGSQTMIDMSIENRVRDGYFCVDENTYIECGDGEKFKMLEVNGLPTCPELYKFNSLGEKAYFTLVFDGLPGDAEWFDIVEYCGDNCFSVLGININEDINGKVNLAFNALDRLDPEGAIGIFKELLPSLKAKNHALTGSVYLNLFELLAANKRHDELRQLVSDFRATPMPHKQSYLEILHKLGY
ncbi:MAG: hypothetical protein KFF49_05860, partial [Bacteroidales bacterium]|nr:hypothetical protein [Bacteroidales bacterium]